MRLFMLEAKLLSYVDPLNFLLFFLNCHMYACDLAQLALGGGSPFCSECPHLDEGSDDITNSILSLGSDVYEGNAEVASEATDQHSTAGASPSIC